MAAGVYNLRLEQGASAVLEAVYSEDEAGAIPIPLTGYSGRGVIKESAIEGSPVLGVITVTVPQDLSGEVRSEFPPSMTRLLPTTGNSFSKLENYWYEVELFNPLDAEDVIRFLNGACAVSPSLRQGV